MGSRPTVAVNASHRPRWRSYLLLARVSNVPTIWSNVLAGITVAGVRPDAAMYVQLSLAASSFYIGGMFLNDAFDAEVDARQRPERPVPAGDVSRRETFIIGGLLLTAGLLLLPHEGETWLAGAALAAAILFYDYRHKGDALAPLVMGVCRGLVYCLAAAAVGRVGGTVLMAAAFLTAYVTALTVVAKLAGANARWLVPLLIAAISLVDAGVISAAGGPSSLAMLAAVGFPITLLLQRVVPGD